jgi:hypothetical protein
MTEIAITFLIVAALIVYVPRVFFLALGLGAVGAGLFAAWLVWGPMGTGNYPGDCAQHWRMGCISEAVPASVRQADCEAKIAAVEAANRLAAPPKPGQSPWANLTPIPKDCWPQGWR